MNPYVKDIKNGSELTDISEVVMQRAIDELDEVAEELLELEGAFDDDCDCDCDCDDCDCDCCCDEDYFEIVCPSCGETICFDESVDPEELTCPACNEKFACIVEEDDLKKIDD